MGRVGTFVGGALALLLSGASGLPAVEDPPDGAEYAIGPQDSLSIVVWQNAEMTRTVPVRPDGKISLPLLNDVQAAGLTPMQLRESLTAKLTEYVPAAEVSVIVAEARSFKVSVLGKVQTTGRFEFGGPTTVLDALAQAGGVQEYSSPERIVILRPQPVQGKSRSRAFKRIPFNYKRVIQAGGEQENFYVQPGDIIVVP